MGITASGYYAWRQCPESVRGKQNRELISVIGRIFGESHGTYGSPRVSESLKEEGYRCSRPRVARLMRVMGIRAKAARKYQATTYSGHDEPIAPNLLQQDFTTEHPNEIWTTDITYVPTEKGWQYLTVVLDVFNRQIVGRSTSKCLTAETTVAPAIDMAWQERKPQSGLIIHSDRGVQYASKIFRDKIKQYGMIQSMSGKMTRYESNCYDNAITESFFKTLKTEWVYTHRYQTHEEARSSLFEYIEVFYNRKRKHSTLGYQSPVDFERNYHLTTV
jgi:transposase InsO family protein